MLVLCSNGLSSEEILAYTREKVRCCAYEKEHSVNVIRINDGDGIFIDSEVYICKA